MTRPKNYLTMINQVKSRQNTHMTRIDAAAYLQWLANQEKSSVLAPLAIKSPVQHECVFGRLALPSDKVRPYVQ